jgi:hypothetical protein
MLNLTQEHYDAIYALLERLVTTEGAQQALVNSIFIGHPNRPPIRFGASGWEFARHVVVELSGFTLSDGTPALVALLNAIRRQVGETQNAQIDALIRRMQAPALPAVAAPVITLPDAPYIFISYSTEDKDIRDRLREDLKAYGVVIWVDIEQLKPGTTDWQAAIRAAIRSCSQILLLSSPDASLSPYVFHELELARAANKPICPAWVKGDHWAESIPLGYAKMQYIDLRGKAYTPENVAKLASALLGRRVDPPPVDDEPSLDDVLGRGGGMIETPKPVLPPIIETPPPTPASLKLRTVLHHADALMDAGDFDGVIAFLTPIRAANPGDLWAVLDDHLHDARTARETIERERERREAEQALQDELDNILALVSHPRRRERGIPLLRAFRAAHPHIAIPSGFFRDITAVLPPPFAWCPVKAGRVDIEGHGTFEVAKFEIAKYPVTNAQYQAFIDVGGYADARWWAYSKEATAFWEKAGK